jgi:hypothetical protein
MLSLRASRWNHSASSRRMRTGWKRSSWSATVRDPRITTAARDEKDGGDVCAARSPYGSPDATLLILVVSLVFSTSVHMLADATRSLVALKRRALREENAFHTRNVVTALKCHDRGYLLEAHISE